MKTTLKKMKEMNETPQFIGLAGAAGKRNGKIVKPRVPLFRFQVVVIFYYAQEVFHWPVLIFLFLLLFYDSRG